MKDNANVRAYIQGREDGKPFTDAGECDRGANVSHEAIYIMGNVMIDLEVSPYTLYINVILNLTKW